MDIDLLITTINNFRRQIDAELVGKEDVSPQDVMVTYEHLFYQIVETLIVYDAENKKSILELRQGLEKLEQRVLGLLSNETAS